VRTVSELERLAEVVSRLPPSLPTLALVDGSLVLWGLSGQGYRPFVRDAIVLDRLLPALEKLRTLAQQRPLALAAYVSFPRSTEVVNAVKVCLCPYDAGLCGQSCNNRRSARPPCDLANEFLDRDLFQVLLLPGWRSPVYRTNSSVPREHYGEEQQVYFFYLHGGEEIGRIEVPRWVAQDEKLLALVHGLVLDQGRRGQGYPVAISEAHEQAVVRTSDRRVFKDMMADALERQGLPAYSSEKERSKRTPWL
jgi:GNAT superfamily N-acetyltransferase